MAKPKIFVIVYSTYGHAKTLAEEVVKGVEEAGGEPRLYQVAETLPAEVLEKMHAPPKPWDGIPVIKPEDLVEADGLIFGFPTRFGQPAAQMRALWDATGGLWAKGALVGKPVSFFFGTGTQNGGQETTALTAMPFAVHHGMIYVPIGYSCPRLMEMDALHGGSAWGAGYLAGADGSRQVSALELEVGKHQGKYFTGVVAALVAGRKAAQEAQA